MFWVFHILHSIDAAKSSRRRNPKRIEAELRRLFNGERSVTVTLLAGVLHMCPRNLHKHTVKRLGVSPHRLIENWKMERAGRLICRHSVAYTARRLGYRNETTLRHTFRRRFQMPPGEWKRRAEGMKAEEIRAAIKKVLGLDYDKTIT